MSRTGAEWVNMNQMNRFSEKTRNFHHQSREVNKKVASGVIKTLINVFYGGGSITNKYLFILIDTFVLFVMLNLSSAACMPGIIFTLK